MGLEMIHQLTKTGNYGLEVTLKKNDGTIKIINYYLFKVSSEYDKFRLTISGFNPGTSGLPDQFNYYNGQKFSTRDQDNDDWDWNCAEFYGNSGWWYKSCRYKHLNYGYGNGPRFNGEYDESTMTLKR